MKNKIEVIVVWLMILLSLGIVGAIIKYSMIGTDEEGVDEKTAISESQDAKVAEKNKASTYLNALEGYKDVDVKVDPKRKAANKNVATVVETEERSNGVIGNIDNAVQTVQKKENYVNKLEGYNPNAIAATSKGEASKEDSSEAKDSAEINADPMSDIVNNIDSIVNTSE